MKKDEMNWARAYQNYLSNFIRTGDPNGKTSVMVIHENVRIYTIYFVSGKT